jgi:hypothetical protein
MESGASSILPTGQLLGRLREGTVDYSHLSDDSANRHDLRHAARHFREYDRRVVRTPVRNLVFGVGIAMGLATIAIVPTIAGVSTWKWLLGVLGLVLFVRAERRDRA